MTCIPIQLLGSLCFVPSTSFINSCWPKKHWLWPYTVISNWCVWLMSLYLCTERPSYAPPPPPAPTTVSAHKFSKRSLLWWPRGRTSSLNSLGFPRFLLHVETKVLSVNFFSSSTARLLCSSIIMLPSHFTCHSITSARVLEHRALLDNSVDKLYMMPLIWFLYH